MKSQAHNTTTMTLKIAKIILLLIVLYMSFVPVSAIHIPGEGSVTPPTTEQCVPLTGRWEPSGECQCPGGTQQETCIAPCPNTKCTNTHTDGQTRISPPGACSCQQSTTNPPITNIIDQSAGNNAGGATGTRQGTQAPPSTATDSTDVYIFKNPLKYNSIKELLFALINGVTIILMPIIVLGIAYIGFRMVLAGQEKNADYNKWKNAFAWSLVGLFLVLGARGILFVIQNTVSDVLGDEYTADIEEVLNP